MTVPSGRARPGVRSMLRVSFCGLVAVIGLLGGCGSNTFTYGTAIITVSADPSPYRAYITDITAFYLLRNDGAYGYTFAGGSGFGKTIDFTKLPDQPELFGAPAVIEGTYTSAIITFNYALQGATPLPAQIYLDVNGTSTPVTAQDTTGTGTAAGTVSVTIKFDPNHPLVIKRGTAARFDIHFDMNVSTEVNAGSSPPTAVVRPFVTASTDPVYSKPLRARGEYVTGNTSAGNFTVNAVSFFDTATYTASAQGALQIQTNDQTTYNVNGTAYQGAAGLAAINALALNTNIAAFGTLDPNSVGAQVPVFNATQVYAGIAVENIAADRVLGTVAARTGDGNTLQIHNAELVCRSTATATGVLVLFYNDLPVTINSQTPVTVDGQPTLSSSIQSISIGQQVDIEGNALPTNACNSISSVTSVDATPGSDHLELVRLSSTPAWGTLNAPAQSGASTINLLSLGGVEPSVLTFTGTGSATGADADPNAYAVNTGSLDLSALTAPLVRFDGNVTPFGSAPPDFSALAVTAGSAADQVLVVDWTGNGTTAPFASSSSSGLVVDLSNASLGPSHQILIGPTTIVLPAGGGNITIVPDNTIVGPDGQVTGNFAIGNPTSATDVNVFQSFGDYLTQIGTAVNGTNTIQKLVAVGQYDQASSTFTAHRINMMQLP
jgi:hypothetical protein